MIWWGMKLIWYLERVVCSFYLFVCLRVRCNLSFALFFLCCCRSDETLQNLVNYYLLAIGECSQYCKLQWKSAQQPISPDKFHTFVNAYRPLGTSARSFTPVSIYCSDNLYPHSEKFHTFVNVLPSGNLRSSLYPLSEKFHTSVNATPNGNQRSNILSPRSFTPL